MARLPRRYAPFVYGVIQACITSGVATAIATHATMGFDAGFLGVWLTAWLFAGLTMLPIVIFISPIIQRCVLALTEPHSA